MKARRFLGILLGLFLCIVPLSAFADTLADLLVPGASIQVGDKIFYDFRGFSSTVTGINADPIAAGNISVVPFIETINGIEETGLRFQSAFFSAGAESSQDTAFLYNVRTVSGAETIDDNFLRVVGGGLFGNGTVTLREILTDEHGVVVADNSVGIPGVVQVQVFFSPQDILTISTDFKLVGPVEMSAGFASGADEFYSQTPIPEPATMLSFGAGLLGLFGFLRKRLFRK